MSHVASAGKHRPEASRGGFSLIELLLAMTIVGLLAGMAMPNLRSMTVRARAAEVAADLDVVRIATLSFNGDAFTWPAESAAGVIPPELTAGSDPYLPTGFSFQGNGYELDYDFLSPVFIPGDPSSSQLVAVAVVVDSDDLSNAVVEFLGGAIVFSLGRRHTIIIERS